jgi:hypothetical protein
MTASTHDQLPDNTVALEFLDDAQEAVNFHIGNIRTALSGSHPDVRALLQGLRSVMHAAEFLDAGLPQLVDDGLPRLPDELDD